jgi:MoaA/NifB/PqqE/SkfB family radical SAM enzyme
MNRALYHVRLAIASCLELTQFLPARPKPKIANVKLTENCNSRCTTCDFWRSRSKDAISTSQARRLVSSLSNCNVGILRFTGGEPLLRDDFFDIMQTIKPGDFKKIVLATNGLLLEQYYEAINQSPITDITVSLDAIGANNDAIRGVPGYYQRALQGLQKIANKNIKIVSTISCVLSDDIENLLKLCANKGYGYDVNLPDSSLPFFKSSQVRDSVDQSWPSTVQSEEILAILENAGIIGGSMRNKIRHYLLNRRLDMKHCALGYVLTTILPNGDVVPGCYLMQPSGNILISPLEDILSQQRYWETARKMFELKCPRCTCGYAISAFYESPLGNLPYALRRILRTKYRGFSSDGWPRKA